MRSIITILFCLTSTVLAANLQPIKQSVNSINSALSKLETAVKSIGAAADAKTIVPSIGALGTAVNAATRVFQSSSALGISDAMTLQPEVSSMIATAHTALDELNAKAPLIKKGGQAAVTIKALRDGKVAVQQFSSVLVTKIPSIAQGVAKQATQQVGALLDDTIAVFSK